MLLHLFSNVSVHRYLPYMLLGKGCLLRRCPASTTSLNPYCRYAARHIQPPTFLGIGEQAKGTVSTYSLKLISRAGLTP
jgi:hypothetical protein